MGLPRGYEQVGFMPPPMPEEPPFDDFFAGRDLKPAGSVVAGDESAEPTRPSPPTPARPAHPAEALDLDEALQRFFGFDGFRAHQREVCEAVVGGQDGLLVMPTGGGKSLCYQLPGLIRGGCTVVISPLIALMEDQVSKLQAHGLRADRIHSGRDREEQRAALRAYLDGELDYLMMAPERLRVPGFPERLASRPPSLVAVDEAHCISMWGHDFRPDYRLLGERLPAVVGQGADRVPILAMTATATLRVQRDIVRQLGMPTAQRFIRGFARDNLAIEVVETSPSQRVSRVVSLLRHAERRPALVYALSRRQVEELAEAIAEEGIGCAAYHAGMVSERRNSVQDAFQRGDVDVVCATVAFGMGIDKADIRTVVHVGVPATIEAYYQEIGRAGRDGQQSRAIALYSWADRRLHDFLRDRSYPPIGALRAVLRAVPGEGIDRERLLTASHLPEEVVEAALDKLWVHGAVAIDAGDNVTPLQGQRNAWAQAYEMQLAHRIAQLDDVFGWVRLPECRMRSLVQYFGSHDELRSGCGHCDHCAPEACTARTFLAPSAREIGQMTRIMDVLGGGRSISAGRLHRDHIEGLGVDRNAYERLLEGLERAGLVNGQTDTFEKDGRTISYRRIQLGEGARGVVDLSNVLLPVDDGARTTKKTRKRRRKGAAAAPAAPAPAADERLVDELKAWRLAKARALGVPAYRVLTNRTLVALAAALPSSNAELLQVKGMGPRLVERFGEELLAEVNR